MSIIDLLPKVVSEGRKEAKKILESLSDSTRLILQTNELVIPSRESNYHDLFTELQKTGQLDIKTENISDDAWKNRLNYGDNLLLIQALLAGDPDTGMPSMRGKRGGTLTTSFMHSILTNPFYYGMMRTKEGLLPHSYEPIVR